MTLKRQVSGEAKSITNMIWYEDLFLGATVSERKKKSVIRKVNKGSLLVNAFVLTLPSNNENKIDIIDCKELCQKAYPKEGMVIIGIANDKEEAMELSGEILTSLYAACGNFDLGPHFYNKL